MTPKHDGLPQGLHGNLKELPALNRGFAGDPECVGHRMNKRSQPTQRRESRNDDVGSESVGGDFCEKFHEFYAAHESIGRVYVLNGAKAVKRLDRGT